MKQSITLQALTELKYQRMITCAEIRKRSRTEPIFALSTALELLAVEKPIFPKSMRFKDTIYLVTQSHNARFAKNNTTFVTWSQPLYTTLVDGRFICTDPVCTWAMLSSRLSLEELVVLGDSMMRRDKRLCRASLEDFENYLQTVAEWAKAESGRRVFRGYHNCIRAVRLMREGTDSSQETRTCIALERYGIPRPKANHPIRDPDSGKTMLLDMAYPELRIAIEYDGRHHASQWLADITRRQSIEEAGWTYIQVTSLDLGSEEAEERMARRVASKIAMRTGKPMPLTARRSMSRICDGRAMRRNPYWRNGGENINGYVS